MNPAFITASPSHAAIMAALHGAAFPHDPWDEANLKTLLTQPGTHGLLNPRGGLVLWRVVADEAEILTIAALLQRQGIGRSLLVAAMAHATQAGAQTMFLEVAASNAPAQALYLACGFSQTGLRKNYYAPGEDALLLSCPL